MVREKVYTKIVIIILAGLLFSWGPLTGTATAKDIQMSMGCGPSVASGYYRALRGRG